MNQVLVLATAHTEDPKCYECFKVSHEILGIPFRIIGTDKPLNVPSNDPRLFMLSIQEAIDLLVKASEPYIIITDCFDVIAARWDERELVKEIENSEGGVLVSCEANCFPDAEWRTQYDQDPSLAGSPWKYANGGQFCGLRIEIVKLLQILRDRMHEAIHGGGANEILHRLYQEDYPFSLDSRCRIFQSMFTSNSNHVRAIEYKGSTVANNTLTESLPMFLHWNGRAPGMPEWYTKITGLPYPKNSARPEYGGVE
jgi:hypothetical protein